MGHWNNLGAENEVGCSEGQLYIDPKVWKVNYGKFGDLLAEVKGVTGKK